jgi:para-aminobenzoate synthetase/4-amino-4-deoxychorismate lyase
LFLRLCRAQRSRYAAYIEADDFAICSASPELFFDLSDGVLTSKPMKGTAPRGATLAADQTLRAALAASAKNRAENAMIVDMMRNDIGRIAQVGSVAVSDVFAIEEYSTLFQMTSTVTARTSAPFVEIVRALFPCASITGAPKVRTMQIIRELEPDPRGVYTGCIGYLAPGGRARFNVAIRTVEIDRRTGQAQYGTGGGIVWDSQPDDEYAEAVTKAAVLLKAQETTNRTNEDECHE